jgi:hypothetical protein
MKKDFSLAQIIIAIEIIAGIGMGVFYVIDTISYRKDSPAGIIKQAEKAREELEKRNESAPDTTERTRT